jgi:DNA-binding phage protein
MKNLSKQLQKDLHLKNEPSSALLHLAARGDAPAQVPQKLETKMSVTPEEIKNQLQTAITEQNLQAALAKARANAKKSYRKIASETGITASRVHEIERADLKLELQTLVRHANALGYEVSLLLSPSHGTGERIETKLQLR